MLTLLESFKLRGGANGKEKINGNIATGMNYGVASRSRWSNPICNSQLYRPCKGEHLEQAWTNWRALTIPIKKAD